MSKYDPLPEKDLTKKGGEIARHVIDCCNLPFKDLRNMLAGVNLDYKDPNNQARKIDEAMHNYAVLKLQTEKDFQGKLHIYGEEARGRSPRSLARTRRTVAFIDAVDGTDLVARRFGNWCCAMVFFHPKQKQILASIVGHSCGDIYYASSKGAFKKTADGKIITLKRNLTEPLELAHSSVCFYGQKPAYFLSVIKAEPFIKKLKEFRKRMESGEKLGFRLYNLGGNPMMVKIPERAVDAVFNLEGQAVHDVVPGAYIAVQAGAVLTDLKGNPIDLTTILMTPRARLTYILAATESLAKELKNLFK